MPVYFSKVIGMQAVQIVLETFDSFVVSWVVIPDTTHAYNDHCNLLLIAVFKWNLIHEYRNLLYSLSE
jgi:hypothetical protein